MGRLRGRNMYAQGARTQCGQRRAQQLFGPPGGSLKADIIGPQAAIIKKIWVRSRANNKLRTAIHSMRAPCELCIWAREMQMSWNYWNGQRGSRRTRGRKQQAFKWQLKPFQCYLPVRLLMHEVYLCDAAWWLQPRWWCHLTAAVQSKEDSISAWMDALCICNS